MSNGNGQRPGVMAAEAWFRKAQEEQKAGNLPEALKAYDKGLEFAPGYAAGYANRGGVRAMLGDHAGAVEDLSRAIASNPSIPEAFFNRGLAYMSMGDFKRAAEDFTTVTVLRPDDVAAYASRGSVKAASGDAEGSIADYTRAVELAPDYAPAWFNRAFVRSGTGDLEGAVKDVTRYIELVPGHAEAHFRRGFMLDDLGETEAATEDYQTAMGLDPGHGLAHLNLAELYVATGRVGEIVDILGDADTEGWSGSERALRLYLMAVAVAAQGRDTTEAEKALAETLAGAPGQWDTTSIDTWLESADISESAKDSVRRITAMIKGGEADE